MTRGKEHYQQNILDESPILVFTATNTAMLDYEYVLGRPEECSPSLAETADVYIMDSGIGNDLSNEEVLAKALSHDADIVVPKDVVSDTEKTTRNVIDMAQRIQTEDINMMVPLQSDDRLNRCGHYDELVDELADIGYDITEMWVAVGGIKDASVVDQIFTVKCIREHVGNNVHLHAFGCGMTKDWIVAIRRMPDIVDSIDSSTVQRTVGNGYILNTEINQVDMGLPRGKNSTCINAQIRESQLYMINYLLGDFVDERDVPHEFTDEKLESAFPKQ